LTLPSPASNTLLITNLNNKEVFLPQNLESIRTLIDSCSKIHSFAPLRSFRRIIAVFYDVESAIAIREALDGQKIMGCETKIYYGEPTPIELPDQHLQAPHSDKLFFISPPPSPPHGWMVREEEPPNKEVMPEDLASALANLSASKLRITAEPMEMDVDQASVSPVTVVSAEPRKKEFVTRNRSGSSTMIYDPEMHSVGSASPKNLPSIAVEDLTASPDDDGDVVMDLDGNIEPKPIFAHTTRPPVELMG